MSGTAMGLGVVGTILLMTPEQRRAMRDLSRKIAGLELEIKEFEEEILKRKEKIKRLQDIMTSDNPTPYTYELSFPEWIGPLEKLNTALYGGNLSKVLKEINEFEFITATEEDVNKCLRSACMMN